MGLPGEGGVAREQTPGCRRAQGSGLRRSVIVRGRARSTSLVRRAGAATARATAAPLVILREACPREGGGRRIQPFFCSLVSVASAQPCYQPTRVPSIVAGRKAVTRSDKPKASETPREFLDATDTAPVRKAFERRGGPPRNPEFDDQMSEARRIMRERRNVLRGLAQS